MESKRLIPYRNMDGYVIERNPKCKRKQRTAVLVRCPETDHLRSIKWCNVCEYADGKCKDGRFCKSTKAYVAGWYSKKVVQAQIILIPKRYETDNN